ncbi:MAG: protein kinase [Verrucomicrobiales bacterium]|nr:protein kinase [Verrucomicrobiales bacterium]
MTQFSLDAISRCQRCNASLVGQSVGGLCANCLLKLAFQSTPFESVERHGTLSDPGAPPPAAAAGAEPVRSRPFGDFELLELVGRGGMGVVYKAYQRSLKRMVALKMVSNHQDASYDTVARFSIEAAATAKLTHPNIVPIYQIGDLEGQPFFSMKLVNGTSLARRRADFGLVDSAKKSISKESSRQRQEVIAMLLAKVARAVHYAHQHGIVHRDLKPNNILIDAEGEPHLTDFGIAKLLESDDALTGTNDVLGTPAYMAPEQASGKAVSFAADIYSLGAILYELLTGRVPFQGKTPLDTLRKVAEEEPLPPVTLNGAADVELAAICLKCLEKDRSLRYESALSLAEDLERWTRGESVQAKQAGPWVRAFRWTRRNPVGATLIVTLCAGLMGALGLLTMVSAEKDKTAAVLKDVERAGQTNAQLLSLTVSMLHEQLEGLWLSTDRRVLHISSEQLAALSGFPIATVAKGSSVERLAFGLAANESPVSDSQKYSLLLAHLERELTERRGRPVRIDLKIFKFKEDRTAALLTNGVHFARMGDIYYLRTKEKHPELDALVLPRSKLKTAVFFTRTNSGIKSLVDLKGRRLAFGDSVSGITFWGQAKLAEAGITGSDLKEYVCLESRSEFIEEVHELGYEAAVRRRGWLHSTADVIEDVVRGRYDAGVTSLRGFENHKNRGLVQIGDSHFERSPNPWVGSRHLSVELARDLTAVLTRLENAPFLLLVPGRPSGFEPITPLSFSAVRKAMSRMEGLFPLIDYSSADAGTRPEHRPPLPSAN